MNKYKTENKNISDEIENEYQERMGDLIQKHHENEKILKQKINDLLAKNVRFTQERNDFENQNETIKNEMEEIKKMYLDKFGVLKETENELNVKIKELELEKERLSEFAERKQLDLRQQIKSWQAEKEIYDQTISELNKNDDKKNLTLIQNEEIMIDLNEKIEKLNSKLNSHNTKK